MATQHDKIFKQLLRVFLADFLRLVVPQALERLDLSSPELLDKELFAGGPHGRRRELDLLVRLRTLDGRPLLIHVEIEARASKGMKDRLWSYCNQIQARYDTPVLTIEVCLKRGLPITREAQAMTLIAIREHAGGGERDAQLRRRAGMTRRGVEVYDKVEFG